MEKQLFESCSDKERVQLLRDNADGIEEKGYMKPCEALPKPVGSRAPIERRANHLQARELMGRYRNTVTMYMQTRKNAIDSLTVIDNRPKTISDSFSIPGAEKFQAKEQPAEQVPTYSDDDFEYKPTKATQRRSKLVEQFYK